MISELSNFAARVRELILSEGRVSRGPDWDQSANEDSWNSSLREDNYFNALALELFSLQLAHNGPYRRVCEARGASANKVRHWTEMSAVPTAAFKELELTCLPIAGRTAVFCSSGTTEQRPSRHFHSVESLAVYEASALAGFRQLVSPGGDLQILTPPPAGAPHSSLVHMFETVRRDADAPKSAFVGRGNSNGEWTLDFDRCVAVLRGTCESEQPLIMLGTAFSFVHLVDFLSVENLRFQVPSGSRVVETGGYKGRSRSLPKAELHALITERLGVPKSNIVCEYGMSELSSQAYDIVLKVEDEGRERGRGAGTSRVTHHSSRIFHFPPWARVQIISPETGCEVADGETGLIRVFDLANVFSVLAVQTEDLGIRRGDGFELIGRAELAEPRGCSLMTV